MKALCCQGPPQLSTVPISTQFDKFEALNHQFCDFLKERMDGIGSVTSILKGKLTCIVYKLYRWSNFENIAWELINNFWPWTSLVVCSAAFDTFSPKKQKNVPLAASWEDFSRDQDGTWHTWSITIWVPEKAGWWSGCVCSRRVQRKNPRPKIQKSTVENQERQQKPF